MDDPTGDYLATLMLGGPYHRLRMGPTAAASELVKLAGYVPVTFIAFGFEADLMLLKPEGAQLPPPVFDFMGDEANARAILAHVARSGRWLPDEEAEEDTDGDA